MRRSNKLLEKRRTFVLDYVQENQEKQMKVIVSELSEKLFVTERTIYTIINQGVQLQASQLNIETTDYEVINIIFFQK